MRRSASTHRVEWQLLTCSSSYMRRSFDGLALAVQERLGEDPQSGSLFVFIKSQSGSSGLIASLLRASRGRGRRRLRRRRSSRWPRTDGEVDRYGDVTAERPALLIWPERIFACSGHLPVSPFCISGISSQRQGVLLCREVLPLQDSPFRTGSFVHIRAREAS